MSRRHGFPLSIVILDIDNFKKFSDNFGHQIGDFVLRKTAQLIKTQLRQEDIFGRFGGEEFLVILPHSNCEEAMIVSEKLRLAVQNSHYAQDGYELSVTISLGIHQMEDEQDLEKVIHFADLALLNAKESGKNKSLCYQNANS